MNRKEMMMIAEDYDKDDEDSLYNELEREFMLAKADYIRKKRIKCEQVDDEKMYNAINNRKKIRALCNKCLCVTLGRGFNFLQEAKNNQASNEVR